MEKRRFAVIGTGGRSRMYWNALVNDEAVSARNELLALMDVNQTRMDHVNAELGRDLPTYRPHQFDEMVAENDLEGIVVTTRDCRHTDYIVRGLEAGLHVVTEKPMCTDEFMCQRILDAMRGREDRLTVTFNYRYAPHNSKFKELVMAGAVGEPTMIEFQWYLDITHGADYYRRWHRQKHNSGSLWVHKATHHFDLANWWISQKPVSVYALGTKRFYRPETFPPRERCLTCDATDLCKFYLDLTRSPRHKALYLDAEREDGYFRDRCVFSPEIDIWDTRAATIGYDGGVIMAYSLNNYAPFEGFRVAVIGTEGRVEMTVEEHAYISGADGKLSVDRGTKGITIVVYPLFKKRYEVPIEVAKGGHGGGDVRLLSDVFLRDDQPRDPLQRAAGGLDGACSILVGVAARRSIESGRPININDLVKF